RWEVRLASGRATTALDIQRAYLEAVRRHAALDDPERARLLSAWGEVLDDLAADPRRCADRLDWVAKHELIRSFQDAEGLADDDPWLQSLDLEYHRLDPAAGLFFGLEQAGSLRPVVDEARIVRAIYEPPAETRARIRGRCVDKFQDAVLSAQWDHITLRTAAGPLKPDLTRLFAPAELARLAAAVEQARTPDELAA
ncbi:MAG TPA: proteasome accessory factor PafA2 family protein, partial [Verrucomicrobiota bacterium]|nr:proteasome accessory factor PafA2 family protein [Verrucomicrobiota bacterium]